MGNRSGLVLGLFILFNALMGCGGPPKAKVNMDKSHIPPSAMRYLNMAPPAYRAQVEQQLQQKGQAPPPSTTAPSSQSTTTKP
ncbi:hypothetical protein [Chthonomonas calidirosea]|uniref:hypothetical protein n=1 Tax=Chthonomonas calidirosea TaxID=454171 RepID=UPI0006EC95B6|nr:hypothetical protein [Chthonomonas calidirosea]CEK16451.1 hypothetical protein CP488_01511 [Chthonomonas calidirosea]